MGSLDIDETEDLFLLLPSNSHGRELSGLHRAENATERYLPGASVIYTSETMYYTLLQSSFGALFLSLARQGEFVITNEAYFLSFIT